MGRMENESGGFCFVEAPAPSVKAILSFSPLSLLFLVFVLNTSHYHTPLSCPLGCLAAEFYFFILTSLLFTQISLYSMLAMPLPVVGGVCPWVYIQHLSSTRVPYV